MRKSLVAGNWKMNMTVAETVAYFAAGQLDLPAEYAKVDVAIIPPFTALAAARLECEKRGLLLGAQNCHPQPSGAFTGEISADFLKELGCSHVLCGHSERRALFQEGEVFVAEKVRRALDAGLQPIVCIGETLEERQAGHTERKLDKQLTPVLKLIKRDEVRKLVVAYEPVWAIGTGLNADPMDVEIEFVNLRDLVGHHGVASIDVRMLYGGSVSAENAAAFAARPSIDGVLVGGASLKPDVFRAIVDAFARAKK